MYQLKNFDRGDLNEGKTAISGTPAREEDFDLDPTGNWSGYVQKTSGTTDLDQDRDHNHVNEIDVDDNHANAAGASITATTGSNWFPPTYDAAGNMTKMPRPRSLPVSYTCIYDGWNRLVEVKSAVGTRYVFEYDALGRRIIDGRVGYPYRHQFLSASWQTLETRATNSENAQPEGLQPEYQYVWSARYIDAPVLRDKNTDTDGLCDDQRLYYLSDANFNVTTLLDTGGEAVERYLYDPYGKVTMYDGPWTNTRSSSSYQNEILYTGREYHTSTGLYYYRGRWYHTALGRFLSRDPVESDRNLYRYVGNSPTNATDPSGLEWLVFRKGAARAKAISTGCNDTVSELADMVRLDPNEYRQWLVPDYGAPLPATKDSPLKSWQSFTVPNTFVIAVTPAGFANGFLAVWQNRITAALQKRGFYVSPYRHDVGASSFDVQTGTRGNDVWGFAFLGHGFRGWRSWYDPRTAPEDASINGAFAWANKEDLITPPLVRGNHRFALVIAYFCYADKQPWGALVSPNGKYYGSTGMLSAMSGPRGVGYWGSWDGLVGTAAD